MHPQFIPLRRFPALIGSAALFFVLLAAGILNYGIDTPQPIAPYLNNTFSDQRPLSSGGWNFVNAFPNLTFIDPIQMVEIPGTNKFLVGGKMGHLWVVENDPNTTTKTTVLNIDPQVQSRGGDEGMLNVILHPEFNQPGSPHRRYLYVFYRYTPNPNHTGRNAYMRLSRFTLNEAMDFINPASELVMIQQYDRHDWHNGSGMFFGPDEFLYLVIGDEGGANDQYNSSQKINDGLFGGILRMDVDQDLSRSHPIRRQPQNPANPPTGWPGSYTQGYTIPNDNPWLDPNGGILEEFYAIGLRSPHRMTYDSLTGTIWIGDVGQGSREEISIAAKGGNLQWPYKEGTINGRVAKPDNLIGFEMEPVYDYPRGVGSCVIGGFVYRGSKYPDLYGKYIFGDHQVRNIWAIDYDFVNQRRNNVEFLLNIPAEGVGGKSGISGFTTDSEGELYVFKLYGTNLDGGKIYKMQPLNYVPEPPQWLSQTGAFTNLTNLTPAPGILPYRVNTPLWSDNATKKRWVAIPNDGTYNTAAEQVVFSEKEEWQFPSGTVFIKHFEMPVDERNPSITKRLETRFIIMDKDGGAYGITYRWNEAGTDARLLLDGEQATYTVTLNNGSQENRTWDFPSRNDCMTCHTANAGHVLGVKTRQLNGTLQYPSGVTDNQIRTWNHLGIFSSPLNENDIPSMPQLEPLDNTNASLEKRVRSYIDANCAHCHRPGGVAGNFDARFSTPLAQQNLINGINISNASTPDGKIVVPNDPQHSELWIRDNAVGGNAMPPLAKNIIDDEYIQVLTDWINSMPPGYVPPCDESTVTYLSDLDWEGTPPNGWGPAEKDRSNGETGATDGNTITINGQTYTKGLGVHANSEVIYTLGGAYHRFKSDIGVDDETCAAGSVTFQVYLDGNLSYSSPVLTQADPATSIELDVTDVNQLRLVVGDGGNGISCDHADWADARLETDCDPCIEQTLPQQALSVHFVDSEELNSGSPGTAVKAIDGNPNSIWHTEWVNQDPVHPHEIQLDLGAIVEVSGFTYLPRQDASFNGTIKDYEFYVSEDGNTWGSVVASGTFPTDKTEKKITFPKQQGQYVRLRSLAEVNGNPWTSAAEITVIYQQCPDEREVQQINFPALADKLTIDPPFNLTATASSGLPVSYQIVSGPATVNGNTITLSGNPGTVVVKASQAGNDQYQPAPEVEQSFVVAEPPNIPPIASASANPTIGYVALTVNFDGSASSDSDGSIVSYEWDFGDGTNGNGATPSHQYTTAGNYTAQLSVTDDEGATDITTVNISVNPKETQTISFAPLPDRLTIDPPFEVNASTSSGLPVSFNVVSGPATIAGSTVTLTGQTGTVIIRATQGGNAQYNPATPVEQSFEVLEPANELPTAMFSATPTTGDAPLTVSFDGSTSSDTDGTIVSHDWDFGDGNTGTGTTTSHTYTTPGTYTASLTVTDDDGATGVDNLIITVNAPPVGPLCFVATNGQVVMEAESYSASTAGTGAQAAFSWESYSDPQASGGTAMRVLNGSGGGWTGLDLTGPRLDYEINFAEAGTYRLWVRTAGASGNDDSFHAGLDGVGYTNSTGVGMGNVVGAWDWTNDANSGQSVAIVVNTPGLHTLNIWMREDGIQIDKLVLGINATEPQGTGPTESTQGPCEGIPNQPPVANFTADPEAGAIPLTVSFDATASYDTDGSIVAYNWDFGDGTNGNGATSSHTYTQEGIFTATLTVTDDEGLNGTAATNISVVPDAGNGLCFVESNGLLVMEAEDFTSSQPGFNGLEPFYWEEYDDVNASGSKAVRAVPNTVGGWSGLNLNGPRLDFEVNFANPGLYYLWVRTSAPSGQDDSFHAGIDGTAYTNLSGLGMGINGDWGWTNDANNGQSVQIPINAIGKHTFNIWMRENGVQVDKIVLKLDSSQPLGTGPQQSAMANCATNQSNPLQNPGASGQNFTLGNQAPQQKDFELVVYPNPFTDEFFFELQSRTQVFNRIDIRILDLMGKEILRQENVRPNMRIQLGQHLTKGVYILRVIADGKPYDVKLDKL